MFKMFMYGGVIKEDICFPKYIIKLLFTVIFPPIGIWIDQHNKNYEHIQKIAICIIFTAMFYFPGLLYALNNISFS